LERIDENQSSKRVMIGSSPRPKNITKDKVIKLDLIHKKGGPLRLGLSIKKINQ
jgi:hypothetical protein